MQQRGRRRAALVSSVAAAAVAWPTISATIGLDSSDGFPLSTYPMFARDRGRVVELGTVVAVDEDGAAHRLDPQAIARTDQVIQAVVTVERAIAQGAAAASALCRDVASRLEDRDVARVEVVVERYDSLAWAGGDDAPTDRQVVASCERR